MRSSRWCALLGATVVTSLALTVVPADRADAAGIVTHAWMAEEAVALVGDGPLAALLRANLDQVRAGASFPDGGYATRDAGVPGGDFGEEAHWHRFHDAYLGVVRDRSGCGPLTDPTGPCAAEVAHLMGIAAHGLGDEVWDWLFEPAAADHGELWIPPDLTGVIKPGGIEAQMDAVAITGHGRGGGASPPEPSSDDLVAAFGRAGRPDIRADAFVVGRERMDRDRADLVAGSPRYRDAIREHMPWTSANVVTAPGGIRFAARAIAAVYTTLWARLGGGSPPTAVSVTAPAAGALDVPASGWSHPMRPGAWPESIGARNRIAAVLSSGLPFVVPGSPPGSHIAAALPAGAAVLTERDTGRAVPQQEGYPRIVPYDPDRGGHFVGVQPAADLLPCTWYRASTTDRLRDATGRAVTPTAWTFRTDGCPPAPGAPGAAPDPGASPSGRAGSGSTTVAVPVPATPAFTG